MLGKDNIFTSTFSIATLALMLAGLSACKKVDGVIAGYDTEQSDCGTLYKCEQAKSEAFVNEMIEQGIIMPAPADPGGGYTHEQHKRNYKAIYQAGQLYRITGDAKYREYVREMLLAYADLYPTLGPHPARKKQNYGKIFWQVLNDAVWLVHAIQGYENIRDELGEADRNKIDNQLFRNAAKFLSEESVATFDLIHNHATWATAGVGMTGYVLDDTDMVERALLGSDKSGEVGFLKQTDLLFSPDGYYGEGPYYQRYAIMPFMLFADAIERNEPERKIFEHRDGILLKALNTVVQLTYGGFFFPFNDAIRDKSLNTEELYHAISIAYNKTRDPALLSIAQRQGRTVLTPAGQIVSNDLAAGKAQPFAFKTILLRDGPNGDQGAVAIIRNGTGLRSSAMVIKNSSQGLGHGHFDKLGWQFYDNGNEIIRDYGAARFLNIEAKEGGVYLPENETWAKQTIAHNALVVDGKSHFDAKLGIAENYAPRQLYFSDKAGAQISSAQIDTAYDDVSMVRTMASLKVKGLDHPLIVDIMRANSDALHRYDLPLHYSGQIMRLGFDVNARSASRPILGSANGYQHIWVDAAGNAKDNAFVTWLLEDRFYTWRLANGAGTQIILGESGANDPNFNLRREPVIIARNNGENTVFASVLEMHGRYDGAAEQTTKSDSQIKSISYEHIGDADVMMIETLSGDKTAFAVSYDRAAQKRHEVIYQGQKLSWKGFAAAIPITDKK